MILRSILLLRTGIPYVITNRKKSMSLSIVVSSSQLPVGSVRKARLGYFSTFVLINNTDISYTY
jgi:hypothetical protein